jgi:hypothetical protein
MLASQALTLGALVDELADWARLAIDDSWRRNRRSLRLEVTASLDRVSARLGAELHETLPSYAAAAEGVIAAPVRPAEQVADLLRVGRGLQQQLGGPPALRATWRDIVDSVKALDAFAAASCARQLERQLDLAGRSGRDELDQLTWLLRRQAWSVASALHQWANYTGCSDPLSDDEAATVPEAELLRLAERMASEPLEVGKVVVWSLYDQAATDQGVLEIGPMTVLMPQWAIPFAFANSAAEEPLMDEIRSLWHARKTFEEDDELRHHVLVRVDLGERSPIGALDAAAEVIDTLMDALIISGSSGRWGTSVWSEVLVDGEEHGSSFGRGSNRPDLEDTYGSGIVLDVLAEVAETFAPALLRGPVPGHLREALRGCAEAEHASSRSVSLYGDWRNHDRTRVLLLDATFEHIVAFARTTTETLGALMQRQWPEAVRTGLIVWAIRTCLQGRDSISRRREENRELEREIFTRIGGKEATSLLVGYRRLDQLTALTRSPIHARTAQRLVGQLGDPLIYREESLRLSVDAELLTSRRVRVRNAVAHGNPVTHQVLDSVIAYSRFRAHAVLRAALTSFAAGTLLSEHLDAVDVERAADASRIDAGTSQITIWETDQQFAQEEDP